MLHVVVGNSAPIDAPKGIGTHYIDRVNKTAYLSVGTDSVLDWLPVSASLGGNFTVWKKIAVTVDNTILTHNYFDLPERVQNNTVRLSVGHLSWSENSEYTLSLVGNKTRITLVGELQSGNSAIELGETIHVTYMAYAPSVDNNWRKVVVTADSVIVSNNYFDLPENAQSNTVEISIGHLNWSQNFDYALSVVNNITRVTFIGDLQAPSGTSAIEVGDLIHVSYKAQ